MFLYADSFVAWFQVLQSCSGSSSGEDSNQNKTKKNEKNETTN